VAHQEKHVIKISLPRQDIPTYSYVDAISQDIDIY